jgi:hypothetical protein
LFKPERNVKALSVVSNKKNVVDSIDGVVCMLLHETNKQIGNLWKATSISDIIVCYRGEISDKLWDGALWLVATEQDLFAAVSSIIVLYIRSFLEKQPSLNHR